MQCRLLDDSVGADEREASSCEDVRCAPASRQQLTIDNRTGLERLVWFQPGTFANAESCSPLVMADYFLATRQGVANS